MYLDQGWKPPWEPQWEPPSRRPRLTKGQERAIVWIVALNVLLLFIAPVGGATVIHALFAMLKSG